MLPAANHPWLRTAVGSTVKTADILVDTTHHAATERDKTKGNIQNAYVRCP